MTKESEIRAEMEQKTREFEEVSKQLEDGEVVNEALSSARGLLAGYANSIAICNLLLGDRATAADWITTAAQQYIAKIEAVDSYEDVIERSYQWHKPTHGLEALNAAILAQDEAAIAESKTAITAIDRDWLVAEHRDMAHVLYYDLAMVAYLEEETDTAIHWLDELSALDHGHTKFDGLETALRGLLADKESTLTTGIEQILVAHHDEYGPEPDTGGGFISIEAAVYLRLAEDAGVAISRNAIDDTVKQYLPSVLPG